MPPGMFPPGVDPNDPEFQEMLKNFGAMNNLIQGSDFEKNLDNFLDQQIAQGVDPEDILKNTLKNYQRTEDPYGEEGKQVEFDPSKLMIDPQLMESFNAMMKERENDPEYQKMIKEMMSDPQMQENFLHDRSDDDDNYERANAKSAQTIIDLDDDEMKDLEELRSADTKSSREELEDTAKNIFGGGGKNKK